MADLTPGSILERLFKVDPRIARVLLVGLAVLAAIAMVGAWRIDPSRILPTFLWLAGGYVVFAFLANMPGWMGALLGGLACFGFAGYLCLFSVQLVAQNSLTPPLMAAGCFFSPAQQGCPMNVLPTARAGPTEVAGVAPEAGTRGAADLSFGEAVGDAPQWEDPELRAGAGETYQVYIQYADRRLDGGRVASLAQELANAGWWVSSELRQLASAYGLNEVRYFHEEDRPAALELAAEVAALAPWAEEVRVRDFTRAGEEAPQGLLEVWVSG